MDKRERSLILRKEKKSFTQFLQVKSLIEIFQKYNKKHKLKVLETGCGYGFFTELISDYCSSLYATDLYDYFPSSLKENKKIKYFKNVDAQKLPFENNFFDVIYSMDVIEHIADDKAFINEGLRVLKKGGDFIIGTPNRNRLANYLLKIIGRERKYPLFFGYDPNYGKAVHQQEYTPEDIGKLLKNSGYSWRVEKLYYLSFGLLGYFEVKCPYFLRNFCQFWLFVIRKK